MTALGTVTFIEVFTEVPFQAAEQQAHQMRRNPRTMAVSQYQSPAP
jgi:hypothetical protein